VLRNAYIFKTLNVKTMRKIGYLFKEEHHLKGSVVIRKRERSNLIFFIKKGTVEIRFPVTIPEPEEGEEPTEPIPDEVKDPLMKLGGEGKEDYYLFSNINSGGYFNLSSALLEKFSLFEFVVSSETADFFILNAADLVLLSKKSEDIFFALQNHAALLAVDGAKYDFCRYFKTLEETKELGQ
jgi:hypothetical protein